MNTRNKLTCGLLAMLLGGYSAAGQTPGPANLSAERRVQAVPVQLGKERAGIALLDADMGTIWIYEFVPAAGETPAGMRLYASRSWLYDRALQNYNQVGVLPDEVRQLVEQQPGQGPTPGGENPGGPAPASQPAATAGTVQMAPVQVERDRYGLAMMDQSKGTVWVYEFGPDARGGKTSDALPNTMRLYAARTWLFDRLLENYRQHMPNPTDVLGIVQRLQGGKLAPTSQPGEPKKR